MSGSPYSPEQERRVLQVARAAAGAALRNERYEAEMVADEAYLAEPRGCFVTLHDHAGQLRGCIGTFEADAPLSDNLVRMAGAATRDPRFVGDPVTAEELARLRIEVSVLTPLTPIEDPTAMRLGVDGVYITGERFGARVSGCFLPQVAIEQGWDVETTLSMCCAHKMGLPADAWRPPTELRFSTFEAMMIEERPE